MSQSSAALLFRTIAFSLSLLIGFECFGQQENGNKKTFRRHFLIAYDISTPFINAKNRCPEYTNTLKELFNNNISVTAVEYNNQNLLTEKENNIPFFNPSEDQISFFHFNISQYEFDYLRSLDFSNKKEAIRLFNLVYLKKKYTGEGSKYWSDFHSNGGTIDDYFTTILSIPPSPSNFGRGVSMSNFVYPLTLDLVDKTTHAEEYIIITLSDFLAGSAHGNKEDFKRIKDIYKIQYDAKLNNGTPAYYIKNHIDYLSSQFFTVDFFEFSFFPRKSQKSIAIIGTKVKPKAGSSRPEDVSVFIDSDITLSQRKYTDTFYELSPIELRFTHNSKLSISEVVLNITESSHASSEVGATVFNRTIATLDRFGKWTSHYTNDDNLMFFDATRQVYHIPAIKLFFEPNFSLNKINYICEYKFKARYQPEKANPLNFIYKTERFLSKENVILSYKSSLLMPISLLILGLVIIFFLWIMYWGMPIGFHSTPPLINDTYQKVDFNHQGRKQYRYWFWNSKKEKFQTKVGLVFRPSALLKISEIVRVRLIECSDLENFNIYMSEENIASLRKTAIKGKDIFITSRKISDDAFSFSIVVEQINNAFQLETPTSVAYKVEVEVMTRPFLFFGQRKKITHYVENEFYIGPDLGDLWVGFDPGTSGSCIAAGKFARHIVIGRDEYGKEITPSFIYISRTKETEKFLPDYKHNLWFRHGFSVERTLERDSNNTFLSVKKLLGYKNETLLELDNHTHPITGKLLSSLLIRGIYTDMKNYVESNQSPHSKDLVESNGTFMPSRAVVAIPNNFTAAKTQDMIDCFSELENFKEVRYIHEAEAVAFYYLNQSKKDARDETLLMFDMGGATINVTLLTIGENSKNNKTEYEIDILGKLGYGIGGDTIDYCLINIMHKYGVLGNVNPFRTITNVGHHTQTYKDQKKLRLQCYLLAKELKIKIIENYSKKNENLLITPHELEMLIRQHIEPFTNQNASTITINREDKFFKLFDKQENNKYSLFSQEKLNLVYKAVKDVTEDIIALANGRNIDKVIFSGRSTLFPYISDTVMRTLERNKIKPEKIQLDEKASKTAVATGACWYGLWRNAVKLNHQKVSGAYGVAATKSATDLDFIELIEFGKYFDKTQDGFAFTEGTRSGLNDDFAQDNHSINFYQVMGRDGKAILQEDKRHKYSRLASIKINSPAEEISMAVFDNDYIHCSAKETARDVPSEFHGKLPDQDITDSNEEHYTWIVQ